MDGRSKLGGKGKIFVDRGLAGAPISAAARKRLRERPQELPGHRDRRLFQRRLCPRARAGRRREPARRAPAGRRASSSRAMAPARSRRCRTPAGRSSRSPAVPFNLHHHDLRPDRQARSASSAPNPAYPLGRSAQARGRRSSTASRSRPEKPYPASHGDFLTTDPHHRSSFPTPSCRRSRSARTPFPISARADAADHARTGSRSPPKKRPARKAKGLLPRRLGGAISRLPEGRRFHLWDGRS